MKPTFLDRIKATLKDTKDRMLLEGKYSPEAHSKAEREAYRTQADRERDGEAEYKDPFNYTITDTKPTKPAKPKK